MNVEKTLLKLYRKKVEKAQKKAKKEKDKHNIAVPIDGDYIAGAMKLPHKRVANFWKKFFRGVRLLYVNMERQNKSHTTLITVIKNDGFYFNKGKYLIDPSLCYYNDTLKEYMADYVEGFALPIKRFRPHQSVVPGAIAAE